ncbi:hypothetical protein ACGF07_34585 [Kitasatospora sp. NPDC048194]|uniref:hypothetical protein n=1 Tax=Kitasatospora sp. NPDC048194 TaxID=3364045 RepID=UPI00372242C2
MTISGEPRGRVLLLAAAPRSSRRRLLDPEHGVSAVAGVGPDRLLQGWTGPVDVVQLVDPAEPQAVLARLQDAAAAAGPVLVYVCGQLVRDHRQHQVHLALARTTESTVRYTALPWPWLARVLSARPAGTTTVVVDAVAGRSCGPLVEADLQVPGAMVLGTVGPPVRRGPLQAPSYTVQLSVLLRGGPVGQRLADLHPVAVAQAGLDSRSLVLGPAVRIGVPLPYRPPAPPRPTVPPPALPALPAPSPPPQADARTANVRSAIDAALGAGEFAAAAELAAEWERTVLRTGGGHLSPQLADVIEAQATIATAAGQQTTAVERWTATAERRLRWAHASDPAVKQAARNALACWGALPIGPERAVLGHRLAQLLRAVGRDSSAELVERTAGEPAAAAGQRPPGW